ncbi:MAG: outer membrane beta-barrel protein [Gemmatimonadaceae bacterium]
MFSTRTLAATALLAGLVSTSANAQGIRPSFSLEGAALYASVSGDDFDGTDAGIGFDAQARVSFGGLSLGLGYQRTSHDVEGLDESATVSGVFVEPRLALPMSMSRMSPFLMGRLGRVSNSLEDTGIEVEASGWSYGAGAGMNIAAAQRVALSLAAFYSGVSFSNAEVDGSEVPDSELSGGGLSLRAGLSIAFGR